MNTRFKARVLLVDDEVAFLGSLSQHLEEGGLKVCTPTRTKEAIETLKDQKFAAIILELAMPGFNGLETLWRIKAVHPEAELIILNGLGTTQSGINTLKPGTEDFFEGPIHLKSLPDKIHKCQEKRVLVLQKRSQQEVGKILQRIWL